MNIVMYFHHQLFPKPYQREYMHRCAQCGRIIFKANTSEIVIANDLGLPWEAYPPGNAMIEIRCHSCKSNYRIFFQ